MTLTLAFWAPYGLTETSQRVDVERQAREWSDAEPHITTCRIVKTERPIPERPAWWQVTVDVELDVAHPDNLTLWGAA